MPRRSISTSAEPPARAAAGRAGRGAALAVGALFFMAAPAFPAGSPGGLFHRDVQVITSTDSTPLGALLRIPSPSDPVYYQAMSVGYHDFGAAIGGDKPPPPEKMIRTIVQVLATVGYLPADAKHRPTQLIVFTWGTLYPKTLPKWDLQMPDANVQINHTQMLRFLGGEKLGLVSQHPDDSVGSLLRYQSRFEFDSTTEAIWDVAGGDLYMVALAGYEFFQTEPEHRKLLWKTKISCPATGLVMADTLPTMVVIAAPFIGRATSRPVWVNAADKLKPSVRFGNPKVEEYLGSGELPVHEEKATPAKAGRSGQ
ncbi:MAG TPA: hypothetical protein VLW52_06580 [Opitutaceae bacterium]|nr:hypothetical protein [Opitutaceae bacterium]